MGQSTIITLPTKLDLITQIVEGGMTRAEATSETFDAAIEYLLSEYPDTDFSLEDIQENTHGITMGYYGFVDGYNQAKAKYSSN